MTDARFIFHDWTDQWYLLAALLLIIGITIALDFQKKERQRRPFRMTSYLLILTAITGLLISPKYRTTEVALKTIIITKGYDQRILDSLLQTNDNFKVYSMLLEDSLSIMHERIRDVYDLNLPNQINTIELLGEGVKEYELKVLSNYKVNFYPGNIPEGITNIEFDQFAHVEKRHTIKGEVSRKRDNKIVLLNNEIKLDSVVVDSTGAFSFSITPKSTGLFLYRLEEHLGDSIVDEYPLPISVLPQQKNRIIFINDYPFFETKYLKNLLAKKGYEVIVRNRYSQDKSSYEYYNTNEKAGVNLSSDQLKEVDILFIDYRSMLNLQKKEAEHIRLMVKDYGLTVLLQNVEKPTALSNIELFEGLAIEKNNEAKLVIQKGISITKSEFKLRGNSIPITSELSTNKLGGYKYLGIGKVGILSLQNSYELVLNGYKSLYNNLWLSILEQLGKRKDKAVNLSFVDEFPKINTPLEVRFDNNTNKKYHASIDKIELALKQDLQLPNRWFSRYWTGKAGWHEMTVEGISPTSKAYVFDESDWNSMITSRRISANKIATRREIADFKENVKYTYHKISPILFYMIFLISIAYLWIEAKL